jgi:isohexenylglutaconyl-CoA hydratase
VIAGITRCSPHANAVTKRLILDSRKMPREELLEESADAFAECLRHDEGREGVTAFLEKRKARWAE